MLSFNAAQEHQLIYYSILPIFQRTTRTYVSSRPQEAPMATSKNSLRALYIDELRDIYNAEKQLTKALPKMAKAASSEELRNGFTEHLEQTKGHVERLEQIFEALGERPSGKKCAGMEGLVEEGSEIMNEDFEGSVMDAALISAAQRVEHYEMAAYGSVIAFAEELGESEHVSPLQQTLEEEKQTDEKLTELSKDINTAANGQQSEPASGSRKQRRVA
jgi:ferritin-like metal-binding protein YciE